MDASMIWLYFSKKTEQWLFALFAFDGLQTAPYCIPLLSHTLELDRPSQAITSSSSCIFFKKQRAQYI
jgi:hypothetical protein